LKQEIDSAAAVAEKARRRAVKAKVKADDAEKAVDGLTPGQKTEKDPPK
jgi:hypothetical protein